MEEEKNQLPPPYNIIEKIKWATIREFFAFIFCFLMYIDNKQLRKEGQESLISDKEYDRKEKKEQNQTLEKMITTMDDVIKFKKSFYEKDTFLHFNSSASNSQR